MSPRLCNSPPSHGHLRLFLPRLIPALALLLVIAGCSSDPSDNGSSDQDSGADTTGGGSSDTDTPDVTPPRDTGGTPTDTRPPVEGGPVDYTRLCHPCEGDDECGLDGFCMQTSIARWCVAPCHERHPCPDGYTCRAYRAEDGIGRICVPETGYCEGCVDADGDGFGVGPECEGPIDCAPFDQDIHPDALEICDGIDNNCDGQVDEGFDLLNDDQNCGECGNVCNFAGAYGTCENGRCQMTSCEEGFANCNLDAADGCEAPASRLNVCGGCGSLPATPGDPCGACQSGAWSCAGADQMVCVGDRGPDARNACGGCSNLGVKIGGPCGNCGRGVWTCDGTEGARCVAPANANLWTTCGSTCCAPGETCSDGRCGENIGCTSNNDCNADRYCDVATGACYPWDEGDLDNTCLAEPSVGRFAPEVQCSWTAPPVGDAHPDSVNVLATPMVVDFNFDGDRRIPRPSIVFTTDIPDIEYNSGDTPTGVIRIIDGRGCGHQFTLDTDWINPAAPLAVGDLDGDGIPEIIANRSLGGLIAYRYNPATSTWGVHWRSHKADGSLHIPTGGSWGGPGIHDLNNDGVPEVLRGFIVYNNQGLLLDDSLGVRDSGGAPANMSFAGDLDGDGRVEITDGDQVWEWNSATNKWRLETYVTTRNTAGYVAFARFGNFPTAQPSLATAPQMVVVSGTQALGNGTVRVQTLEGTVVFGPIAIPGGGRGGPPTIGDFDGDGRPEIAVAGQGSFTVFDLDCVANPEAECESRRTDGILWTRPIQDVSSSQTGSAAFDFEGDGPLELAFGDECFVRVYDGTSGSVLFSQQRSSCTWNENPVIADVDGDFNAELIVGSNLHCDFGTGLGLLCQNLGEKSSDSQFRGIRCDTNLDCPSGVCHTGYCRCTTDAQCCSGDFCEEAGLVCTAPMTGTPGTGNVCRAAHNMPNVGVRVYRDAMGRWVGSRRIWNQHAYNITNVNEDGTIPRTSAITPAWRQPGLNSYRANTQGDIPAFASPDLTVDTRDSRIYCDPALGMYFFNVPACNRGTKPIDTGTEVVFRQGSPGASAPVICTKQTQSVLWPGECEDVQCRWVTPPRDPPGVDVWVVADPGQNIYECAEGNGAGLITGVYCN